MHMTNIRQIIKNSVVLCNSIVPDGDRVVKPTKSDLELWFDNMLEQELKYMVALTLTFINYIACK